MHTSYTNGMLDQRGWGRLSKCSRLYYHKSSLVTNFVQTYCLISIYNGIYTVCSNEWTGQTGWPINRTYHLCVQNLQVFESKVMDNILIYLQKWDILDPNSMQTQHLSPVLCCKHDILMYLDENLTKPRFSMKKKSDTKILLTPKALESIWNIFKNKFILLCAPNVMFQLKHKILATYSQN